MPRYPVHALRLLQMCFARIVMVFLAAGISACSSPGLKPWHTVELDEEFTIDMVEDGRV